MENTNVEFVDGEWNSCDIPPSEDYDMEDVLIRRKGVAAPHCNSYNINAYKLARYNATTKTFENGKGENVFADVAELAKHEYKFIE